MLIELDKVSYQCKFKFESNINVYKKLTNSNMWDIEKHQWRATTLLYIEAEIFLNCGIGLENGYKFWKVAKWDVSVLHKVKYMFKLLVTNKEKCGFNCNCNEKPTTVHRLFECPVVDPVVYPIIFLKKLWGI